MTVVKAHWRAGWAPPYRCGRSGFDSQVGQIGPSVADGSPPRLRFFNVVMPRR